MIYLILIVFRYIVATLGLGVQASPQYTDRRTQTTGGWEKSSPENITSSPKDYGSWRFRTTTELEDHVAQPDIIAKPKAHRLCSLGHLDRLEEDRNVKETIWVVPPDEDQLSPQVSLALDWQKIAQDREKSRNFVLEAKTHFESLRSIL